MKNKKVIMFDFDNTLVDSLKYWYKSIGKDAFKHFGVKINKDFEQARVGLTNYEIAECFVKMSGAKISTQDALKFWHEDMIKNYKTKIKMIKGAREYLDYLKNKGYTLVLASATPLKVLNIAIKHFNLQGYFKYIFTEESLNAPKREPLFYENLLNKLNIEAKDLFIFEDSSNSLKSAHSLEIETCTLITKYNKKRIKNSGKSNKLTIKNYKTKKLETLGF